MDQMYVSYLELLKQLTDDLEQLSDLAHQKMEAVRKDDLNGLSQVLKQEQVLSLALRGLENKRQKALEELHLESVPLSHLAAEYPAALQVQAKETTQALGQQYKIYQGVSNAARDTLECNLHEIEKALEEMGADPTGGPGYLEQDVPLPARMRTDIRA
jgi:hypothetical protein